MRHPCSEAARPSLRPGRVTATSSDCESIESLSRCESIESLSRWSDAGRSLRSSVRSVRALSRTTGRPLRKAAASERPAGQSILPDPQASIQEVKGSFRWSSRHVMCLFPSELVDTYIITRPSPQSHCGSLLDISTVLTINCTQLVLMQQTLDVKVASHDGPQARFTSGADSRPPTAERRGRRLTLRSAGRPCRHAPTGGTARRRRDDLDKLLTLTHTRRHALRSHYRYRFVPGSHQRMHEPRGPASQLLSARR